MLEPKNTGGDMSIIIPHAKFGTDGYSTPPGQSLANSNMSMYGHQSPPAVLPTSYSLETHQVPGSPSKPKPTDALDLSDGDDRHTKSPLVHIRHRPSSPVLMVDAGGRQKDPDASEVEIRTDLVSSPAKVICHAPAVVESDLRNTGYTQEAAKVQVDSIPSVSLHDNLDVTAADQPPTKIDQRTKPVKVVKEKQPTGRVVASRYMQSTASVRRKANNNTSSFNVTRKSSSLDNTRKSSTQKSVNTTRKSTSQTEMMRRPPSSVRPAKKQISRKTSKSSSRVASKPSLSDTMQMLGGNRKPSLSETVMDAGKGPGGVTSTPALSVSRLPSRSGLDASAIQPIHGMSVLMNEDVSMIAQLSHSGSPSSHRDADSAYSTQHTQHTTHKRSIQEPEITQDYLDRVYAVYLQWVFIDSKLRKSFQEQENDAMGQIFALWCENEKMRKRKAELELEMARIKHENHVDEQLEIQRSGLGPIAASSDVYKHQYSTMAHALDTTRHQLPLKGIHVPDDEEQYQGALISALDESEQLLQQLNLSVGTTQGSKVTSFAKAMQTLENVVENEDKELKRCQELLAATSSLTTHASSLQIQQLEAQR
ncbi:uncharacterized protein [Amphiura filiformis]|uniref:uncharacterized protein isoform X2 n=1 Tax=Amphiura filiformis TaxID=82378 RepID=UPI003B20B980